MYRRAVNKWWWLLAAVAVLVCLDVAMWWSLCMDCSPRELLYPWKVFGI